MKLQRNICPQGWVEISVPEDVMLVVLTIESVNEMLKCDDSDERYWAVP